MAGTAFGTEQTAVGRFLSVAAMKIPPRRETMLKLMIRGWMWFAVVGLAGGAHAAQNAPAANSRYVIQGETVYDKKTNVTWQRCSVGQQWVEPTGCAGVVKTFTFDVAMQQGDGSWHVPPKDKLATLLDRKRKASKQKPAIDALAFPDMDLENLVYWSSTPRDAANAWFVSFDRGYVYYDYRSTPRALRLMRNGH
jgi:hypothetical protein